MVFGKGGWRLLFCVGLAGLTVAASAAETKESVRMLEELAKDYAAHDVLPAAALSFGVEITGPGGGRWCVRIDPVAAEKVTIRPGFPGEPSFFFTMDAETLDKICRGQWNFLTAGGRARMSDPAPLDLALMEGFAPPPDFLPRVALPLGFHFFTPGVPEVLRFGEDHSRRVHGGNAVPLYYDLGLRTAWYKVTPGMMINRDPADATNPFSTLLIFTRGRGTGRLGDRIMLLEEGLTLFVPAGMVHQIWTDADEGLEFVIIMFGTGA
ncbi:MAG: AraC family ligand binding domain-containing protein [Acidobacteria bacterium]|nr:AraC family ligand binding domain-containing protein [Acidobacteriota bacterium]